MIKIVKVLIPNIQGKAIIQQNDDLYIVPSMGYFTGQEMQYDLTKGIKVPSLLFAISLLNEPDFEKTVEFIRKNW